jgi:hypothetical protein
VALRAIVERRAVRGEPRSEDVIVTAVLHYGLQVQLRLDEAATKLAVEAIGAHATRGGWVTITDVDGKQWTVLISAGIPIWIAAD